MNVLVKEWLKRALGYGALVVGAAVAARYGSEAGALVGSAVSVAGGLVLNKAERVVLPTRRKLIRAGVALPPSKAAAAAKGPRIGDDGPGP